jgi:hypothetical protein
MSPADLDFLDTSDLPRGLSEQAYVTWRLGNLRTSPGYAKIA